MTLFSRLALPLAALVFFILAVVVPAVHVRLRTAGTTTARMKKTSAASGSARREKSVMTHPRRH